MKLLIFALVLGVILQAMAASIESWKNEKDDIDSANLDRAIKNIEKVEKALKAVEAAQKLEEISPHQRTMSSVFCAHHLWLPECWFINW
uniref:Uncharacterized protein n=1 Tax=Panagrolaimus sp. PS1159 TaxID=55785 RepID=A0AC35EWA6_9BILA